MSKEAQELENRYQSAFEEDYTLLDELFPVYHANGFAFPQMPVITNDQPNTLQLFHWGLIPRWTKSPEDAQKIRAMTLNAKSETVFEKPAFRGSIMKQRCLVPADGFYEWMHYKSKKYPHFIYCKSHEIYSMAGIWEQWTDKQTGEVLSTYSVLTTEANPLLSKIHNTKKRMPVILHPENEKLWLDNSLSKEDVLSLTVPFDEHLMNAHTVSKLITSRTEDSNVKEIQEVCAYGELVG